MSGLAALALALWAGSTVPVGILPLTILLGGLLLSLAAFDLAERRLPDILTGTLALTGLGAGCWLGVDMAGHLAGGLVGLGGCLLIRTIGGQMGGPNALGLGDAKLCGAAGIWLGWQGIPALLLLAALGALGWYALAGLAYGRKALTQPMPFGVALTGALWLLWLYGIPA